LKKSPFRPFPKLTNKHIHLRELNSEDADRIYKLRTDPAVTKYIQRALYKSTEEANEFISAIKEKVDTGTAILWAIHLKNSSDLVGTICIWNISDDRKVGELGYELLPHFQKQGIMSAAMDLVIEYGFHQLELDRLEAYTHNNNAASIGLLERKSFQLDPVRRDVDVQTNRIFLLHKTNKNEHV